MPLCRRLGTPGGLVTCSHPGSLHLCAYTVFTALLCQPHCQLWECQHASFLLPVKSHEMRSLLPMCWTSAGLGSTSDIQRPAVLHSIPKTSSRWMQWMKCKCCFMSCFHVVTSGCTGVLGAAGMGDVCTWLSHAEVPFHLGSTWRGEESLCRDTTDLGVRRCKAAILTTPGCQKHSLLSHG